MKNIFLSIFLLLNLSFVFGQNYIEYYNFCNEGDKQIYLKNYEKALENYEKAFNLVDYIHTNQYSQASKSASQIGDYDKTYLYSKKSILNGKNPKFLKEKDFKNFRKTNKYKNLKDSISFFQKQYLSSINIDFKNEIDSLYYIDQRIIRKNKSVKGNYNIHNSELPANLFELDSAIFVHLLSLINKYGFPSEKNVGYESYTNASILFHHNVRLPQNSEYLFMLKEALFKGEYLPINYAWMYDQSRMFKQEKPYFYYGVGTLDNLSDDEKIEIDKRRYEYGIKPLESTVIKKNRKWTVQKNLW